MISYLFSMLFPVLLHMILSDASVMILTVLSDGTADSALCTSFAALLVLPSALWMYHRDEKWRKNTIGIKNSPVRDGVEEKNQLLWKSIVIGAACFVGGGLLNLLWSRVLLLLHVQDYFSNQTQENLLAAQLAVQVIGLGILVPFAEELIFRGLLYSRMRRVIPVWASIFFSSALFALYHGNMIQILFAFPMAVILNLLYEKGRWLGYPILFHMGVNLTTIVVEALL